MREGELTVSQRNIARLKTQLKKARITHDRVAREANVTRTMVVHVLSGRAKSSKVIAAAERLLDEARRAA
jgi:hypothetical protein